MPEASTVILNANVITLDPEKPRAEAIAIQNNKIIAVGTNAQIKKLANDKTAIIDAKGKTVVPGLTDCHVHMTSFGQSLRELDLRKVTSIKEMKQKLREYARKNPGTSWILGGRWDQEGLLEKRYPNRFDLDAVVSDRPVYLTRVCGHIGVANTKALQEAKITKETSIESGQIDLDDTSGEPNGILRENALDIVRKAIPNPSPKQLEETCLLACKKAVEAGLACVHWMIGSATETKALLKLHSEEKLPIRVYLGIPISHLEELIDLGITSGFGNDMIKIGFVKILADGSLGGRTAALKAPYADKPETSGMMLYTQKQLNKLVSKAHNAGLQLAIHAIGDYAVEAVLKAYENTLNKHPREKHRHRIEHCSVLNPKLINRMKRASLIASVQPHFIVSDFWAAARVGKERARWVYPLRTLLQAGLAVVSGSDCPVEKINPILGIWAAVTRKDFPEERLTTEEALKTYTVNAAYASFDETKRGTIEAGKLADVTILSEDLLCLPSDRIKDIAVEMTIINGKIAYTRKRAHSSP